MHVYMSNICAKFHPDPTLNNSACGFFEEVAQQEQQQEEQVNSD